MKIRKFTESTARVQILFTQVTHLLRMKTLCTTGNTEGRKEEEKTFTSKRAQSSHHLQLSNSMIDEKHKRCSRNLI